ncbi:hypothetical protein ACLOJK_029525 [Asimina triloba]
MANNNGRPSTDLAMVRDHSEVGHIHYRQMPKSSSGARHHITDGRCRAEDPTERKQLVGVSIPSSRPTVPVEQLHQPIGHGDPSSPSQPCCQRPDPWNPSSTQQQIRADSVHVDPK